MLNAKELLEQLSARTDPRSKAALARLEGLLRTAEGQQLTNVSRAAAERIERAAQAAQAGNQRAARAELEELLHTPEGAALAERLRRLLGQ